MINLTCTIGVVGFPWYFSISDLLGMPPLEKLPYLTGTVQFIGKMVLRIIQSIVTFFKEEKWIVITGCICIDLRDGCVIKVIKLQSQITVSGESQ
jgi:hypothetical protein